MSRIFLGIGTNLGDREANIKNAITMTEEMVGHVICSSSVWETEPWGFESKDMFLNVVIEVETRLTTLEVMERILEIETKMGRLRSGKRYSSRLIDIDILLSGDIILNTGSLIIPHPRLHERRFVLMPLSEIAPGLVHPVLGKDIATLLEECADTGKVKKWQ